MSIAIGTQLGSHEITALLGKGGMGEVYLARDTKLKREVAIKILPDEFSRDPDRVIRFQREAEVLASLNHPNIAAIYDLEEASGSRYLVLELVEGETLAERIHRSPIPVEEALDIATHICEALEAAHEKGVVHRDLKPANIKITPDGKVKVLDFGLAKAFQEQEQTTLSNSPTLMSASVPGVILGTAAYMSPEQAKGRPVDRRTDIFAFGCVLYEMLTGKAAFDAEDVTEILAHVLTREPDWKRLPPDVPASIHRLLRLCLKKDAKLRRQSAGDIRIDLQEALAKPSDTTVTIPARNTRVPWIIAAVASLLTISWLIPAVRHLRETPAPLPPEIRLDINTPRTAAPIQFALSPDGRYLVFVASGDGPQRLWLRELDKTDAQPMAGTEGAEFPFWSADSRSIGFFASGKLSRIDLAGGTPQALATTANGRGGTWNADGTILFASGTASTLSRIDASGGEPVDVTRVDSPRQVGHRFPQFLPDGHHFLFYANGRPEAAGIYLGSLDGAEPKRLTAAETAGAYLAPDRVVFVRQGVLLSRRLDLAHGELNGDSITLAGPVAYDPGTWLGAFSVSGDSRVAYRAGTGQQQLTWFDRSGKVLGQAGEPDENNLGYPELSPDGRRVAVERTVQSNSDVWLLDLIRGGYYKFTSHVAQERFPLWSPDGTQIVFSSTRNGIQQLFVKPSSGAADEQLLGETPYAKQPQDWSKDGRWLLYYELDPKTQRDLWALDMMSKERRVVVNTPADERIGQFSPEGHWVAYETNASGPFEIVVQAFPEPAGKSPVSTGGGVQPRWSPDGKEIYFIAPDGKMMAAPVKPQKGATFEAGTPVALFPTRIGNFTNLKPQYALSRDGRFLINQPLKDSNTPITLILNWKPKP